MMQTEFEAMTGIIVTAAHYAEIEKVYMDFDGDKAAFCEAYKENRGGIAEKIARNADWAMIEKETSAEAELGKMHKHIKELKAELEREQEWKPIGESNMSNEQYQRLQESGKVMSDEAAVAFIAEECGFAPERITILHTITEYEISRHGRMRKTGQIERLPVYDATDWHYMHFTVRVAGGRMEYEYINGTLETM